MVIQIQYVLIDSFITKHPSDKNVQNIYLYFTDFAHTPSY